MIFSEIQNVVKNCDDLDILLEMLLVCQTNFLSKLAMEKSKIATRKNVERKNVQMN